MDAIQSIRGFADLFPQQASAYAFLESCAREVFGRYGFGELRTPIVERTELFARGIGEETDVVSKEMYTFADRRGRSLTLRPEATAGVARAFIESKAYQPGQTFKYFTMGPMFRYERPQAGRMRQFHQINVEVFGAESPLADAELMLMLGEFLATAGITGVRFELNSLGCPECRPVYRQTLTDFFHGLRGEELCADCQRRAVSNPLRVLDCKQDACRTLTADAPLVGESLCPACQDHFAAVRRVLDTAGLEYELNPRLVRGLDYYQRTTYEVVAGTIGAQSSVAGGGRYDGLVKLLGGPDVPGTGFACGMERLVMLLGDREPAKPDFFVAVLAPEAVETGLAIAQALRTKGLAGEASFEAKSLKSQMRAANRSGAGMVYILGAEELASGTVQAKDMTSGEQRGVELARLLGNTTS